MPSEIQQLQNTIDDIGVAVKAMRDAHEAELSEIKERGEASAETRAKVEAANADITKLRDAQEEQGKILREVETAANRLVAPAGGDPNHPANELHEARMFTATVTGKPLVHVPDQPDMDVFRAYKAAWPKYLAGMQSAEIMNQMSVGTNPEGGYWAPPDTSGRIVQQVFESSPMRALAFVQPTAGPALEGPLDLDEAGSGWVGETEARPETTTPAVGEYHIAVQEVYAEPRTTQKMLDDSIVDIDSWLTRKIADRFARQENEAFVTGNGVKRPRGFATYPSGTPSATNWDVVERQGTGTSADFDSSDPGDVFFDTVGLMKVAYRAGAVWGYNRTVEAAIRKMQDGQGNYLWQPSFQAGVAPSLIGHGTVLMEDMAALAASSLSIVLGNFREAYTIADRLGVRVLRDPFTTKGFVKFYSTRRVGGGVTNFEALKLIIFI